MVEERYKVGDKIKLTYIGFEKPQIIETEISEISQLSPYGINLPLGSQGLPLGSQRYVAYYHFKYFKEKMRIKGNELIVER